MKKGGVIICIVLGILLLIGAFHWGKQSGTQTPQNLEENQNQPSLPLQESMNNKETSSLQTVAPFRENYGCQGSGAVNFTSPPRRLEDLDNIQPLGLMIGSHVTPIDHQYWNQPGWKRPDQLTLEDLKDVLAPADGVITTLQRMPQEYSLKNTSLGDYRLIIHHTCTFYTIYIHLYWLSPKLQEALDNQEEGKSGAALQVKAGELLGKAGGFDFSVHNDEILLKGFLVPEHYAGEGWKIHTVDPFDYFNEPLKSQLTAKVLRTVAPLGGKIDYDIDGKLIGNWFKENTGGYSGKNSGTYGYWATHLAFAPQANDPSEIIASLGEFKGEAQQFGIKGNAPNPAEVGVESGMVKYELVTYDYYTQAGLPWDRKFVAGGLKIKNNDQQVEGTLLVQLIEQRKLKAEVFPNKKAQDVQGFTEKALIYER